MANHDCILGGSYQVNLAPLAEILEKGDYALIVLQAPEGLQRYLTELERCIAELTGFETVIQGDPIYGACDLHLGELSKLASQTSRLLVVHIGHTPYPPDLYEAYKPSGIDVVYLNAESTLGISDDAVKSLKSTLRKRSYSRIGLVATIQHVNLLKPLKETLKLEGVEAVIPKGYPPYLLDGQVIGCDYRVARRVSVDAYVIVAGGSFHAIGLYLATLRDVIQLDPYTNRAIDVTPVGSNILRKRLYLVAEASNMSKMGIILGLKDGQFRPHLAKRLARLAESRGRRYYMIATTILNEYVLRNIDNDDIEFYTVTSCPRIAVDDLGDFEKPVLTPGEAFMALEGRLEPYRFPW